MWSGFFNMVCFVEQTVRDSNWPYCSHHFCIFAQALQAFRSVLNIDRTILSSQQLPNYPDITLFPPEITFKWPLRHLDIFWEFLEAGDQPEQSLQTSKHICRVCTEKIGPAPRRSLTLRAGYGAHRIHWSHGHLRCGRSTPFAICRICAHTSVQEILTTYSVSDSRTCVRWSTLLYWGSRWLSRKKNTASSEWGGGVCVCVYISLFL